MEDTGGVAAEQELSWVLQAKQGDQHAFARLVEAYQGPVYNLAYRMLGNSSEAEDAVQETFLRVYTKFSTYDTEFKFSSWILSIASHHCVDRLRRRRGNLASLEEIQASRWVPDEKPRPEALTLREEKRAALRDMLKALPAQYRLVIVLRYWHDMSYEEIAEVTESTQSAVKSRLHRARRMMASRIEEQEANECVPNDSGRRVRQNAVSRCI